MSDYGFISPLRVENLAITESSYKLNGDPIPKDYDVSIRMSMGFVPTRPGDGDGRIYDSIPLDVELTLLQKDDHEKELGTVHVSGSTVVSLPEGAVQHFGEDKAMTYLRASGISILYGHMRSHMMTMSVGSPISPFIMPAIDPVRFLKSAKHHSSDSDAKQ